MIIEFIITFIVGIFAYLDYKYKSLPAFVTTTVILGLVFVYPNHILFGVIGFLFGIILYELDFSGGRFFGGFADVKVITIIFMLASSFLDSAVLMLLTGGVGVAIATIRHFLLNIKTSEEFPFIPSLLVVLIIFLTLKETISF